MSILSNFLSLGNNGGDDICATRGKHDVDEDGQDKQSERKSFALKKPELSKVEKFAYKLLGLVRFIFEKPIKDLILYGIVAAVAYVIILSQLPISVIHWMRSESFIVTWFKSLERVRRYADAIASAIHRSAILTAFAAITTFVLFFPLLFIGMMLNPKVIRSMIVMSLLPSALAYPVWNWALRVMPKSFIQTNTERIAATSISVATLILVAVAFGGDRVKTMLSGAAIPQVFVLSLLATIIVGTAFAVVHAEGNIDNKVAVIEPFYNYATHLTVTGAAVAFVMLLVPVVNRRVQARYRLM